MLFGCNLPDLIHHAMQAEVAETAGGLFFEHIEQHDINHRLD